MFKSILFATALVAVEAWERDVKADKFATEAYGVDNQHYGHQGRGGYGYGHGHGYGNSQVGVADSHNSIRQGGHQGQGHNQWVDNAWNQWGTNNHWDTQKSVDNKWGNNSGKINVNLNSVSGHYDNDYGHQQRGLGYEGHQNVSGEIGYSIGLGGHSFGYAPGSHSYGYTNKADYGYGGWANNLGAWNHGANYDNFGEQHIDDQSRQDQANKAEDTAEVKTERRVGYGYGDIDELDDDSERTGQYGNIRFQDKTGFNRGTGQKFNRDNDLGYGYGRGYGYGDSYGRGYGSYGSYGLGNAGRGVQVDGWRGDSRYGSYGNGYNSYNKGYGLNNGYGHGSSYGSYGRPLGGDFLGRGSSYGYGKSFGGYGGYGALNGW